MHKCKGMQKFNNPSFIDQHSSLSMFSSYKEDKLPHLVAAPGGSKDIDGRGEPWEEKARNKVCRRRNWSVRWGTERVDLVTVVHAGSYLTSHFSIHPTHGHMHQNCWCKSKKIHKLGSLWEGAQNGKKPRLWVGLQYFVPSCWGSSPWSRHFQHSPTKTIFPSQLFYNISFIHIYHKCVLFFSQLTFWMAIFKWI